MEYSEIKKLVLSGCEFEYISYDHKSALKEYCSDKKYSNNWMKNPDCHDMPEELKEKHKVVIVGRLREIHFDTIGLMWRFKIGKHYPKTFYIKDFGVKVDRHIKGIESRL